MHTIQDDDMTFLFFRHFVEHFGLWGFKNKVFFKHENIYILSLLSISTIRMYNFQNLFNLFFKKSVILYMCHYKIDFIMWLIHFNNFFKKIIGIF